MHRVNGDDLRHRIYVTIRTAPRLITSKLRSKLPHEGDAAASELADRICRAIDNDSYMVIRTERVGLTPETRLGIWGVDEPDPTV